MTDAAAPLLDRLPYLDGLTGRARNGALGLLASLRPVDAGARLRVRAEVDDHPPPPAWFVFETPAGPLRMAPTVVDGLPALELAETSAWLPESLADLGRLEPLLVALEAATGQPLLPAGVDGGGGEATLTLTLTLSEPGGRAVHALRLCVPPEVAAGWPAPRLVPGALAPALAAAPARCAVLVSGPDVSRAAARALQPGDLLMLPGRSASRRRARLAPAATDWGAVGELDLHALRFTVSSLQGGPMLNPSPEAPEAPAATAPAPAEVALPVGELPVRLHVRLAALTVPMAELAALQPGSVLSVGALESDVVAEIVIDGARLAEGRLIALGEAYGVLIDRVEVLPAP